MNDVTDMYRAKLAKKTTNLYYRRQLSFLESKLSSTPIRCPKEKDREDIPLCDQGNLPICGFSPWIVWISDLEILEDPKSPQNPQNPLKDLGAMVSSQLP